MRKNSHFSGQPLYGQVIKLLDKAKMLDFSRENGGERYTKRFKNGKKKGGFKVHAAYMPRKECPPK